MNRDETIKCIAVMQAFIDGAEIEGKNKSSQGKWAYIHPSWNFPDWDYRIKPQEPREFLLYPVSERPSKWGVEEDVLNKGWNGAIKVREVL